MRDWAAWHDRYDDPRSPLASRLEVVGRLVDEAIAARQGERLRVLSLCAGDGRDVLPALGRWSGRTSISARLVELDERLADRARASAAELGLAHVEVVCGDAARAESYLDAVPAGLVVACGIFGNVSDGDVERTIAAMPGLCARRGFVIWTRHRRAPDLTPAIRGWFAAAGFEERAFESPGPNGWAVGMHEFAGPSRPVPTGEPLFAFVR